MSETKVQSANTVADTAWIVERARVLGFERCGVVRAEKFPELERTVEWLGRGYGGEMNYLKDARRSHPEQVMEGLRSVIVCALNYNATRPRSVEAFESDAQKERGWISRYAWGRDYHEVLGEKLRALSKALAERFESPFDARVYADTGPVNERVFAKHAGLGWLGKNTLLLNAKLGSWFFLGVILTTLELMSTVGEGELPAADLCGSCTKCIEACPTSALVEPYVMDARRCISYLTIELRGSLPEELRAAMGSHVFGCDICQDVCPWNRRAPVTEAEDFQPKTFPGERFYGDPEDDRQSVMETSEGTEPRAESLFQPRLEWLASLTEEKFREMFRGSAIKRTKWRGLVRNACIALGNSKPGQGTAQHQRVRVLLSRLANSSEPIIKESAQWALARIE